MTPLDVCRAAGVEPDPWQAAVLASTGDVLMLASRQVGKSLVASVLAAHQAAAVPGSLTLVLSPSLRQSTELYRRIRGVLDALGEAVPASEERSATRLSLANGSRVLSLPGGRDDTIRGFPAVDLLVIDEAARVADPIYEAARPMLAVSRGRLVALSTPWGRRGWYHREWEQGGDAWVRARITADQCPRIDPAWLQAERDRIGDWAWEQEFMCAFKDASDQYFRTEDVDAMADDTIVALYPIARGAA
jgi:hypothetical protein